MHELSGTIYSQYSWGTMTLPFPDDKSPWALPLLDSRRCGLLGSVVVGFAVLP